MLVVSILVVDSFLAKKKISARKGGGKHLTKFYTCGIEVRIVWLILCCALPFYFVPIYNSIRFIPETISSTQVGTSGKSLDDHCGVVIDVWLEGRDIRIHRTSKVELSGCASLVFQIVTGT